MENQEEKQWLKKFYEGSFLAKGWNGRSKELLSGVPADQAEAVRSDLEKLGDKIGREWSKDNSIRKIDTAMLQKWGDKMLSAKKKGASSLIQEIKAVETEVERILA